MAGKRRRSNSRADDGAAGEHEDEDAAAPVGPTASVSEVQQQDFQPNLSQHKERAIPQYGGPQANAAAASQIMVFPPSHTFFDPSVFAGSLY